MLPDVFEENPEETSISLPVMEMPPDRKGPDPVDIVAEPEIPLESSPCTAILPANNNEFPVEMVTLPPWVVLAALANKTLPLN